MLPEDEQVDVTQEPEVQETGGGDKPYAQYLTELPTSVVPLVEPIFQKWDSDTGRRFQEVHSKYEPLKAYQDFADNEVDPRELEQGYRLLAKLQEDPRAVYDLLGKSYGFVDEQGQGGTEQPGSEDFDGEFQPDPLENPRFADVEKMTRTMAQFLVEQEQAKEQQAQDEAIDQEISAAKSKHGDFDEEYVLTKLYNNPKLSMDDAVGQYNAMIERQVAARKAPKSPVILGSGGGVVTQPVDVSVMTPKERRAYTVERLRQAAQEP